MLELNFSKQFKQDYKLTLIKKFSLIILIVFSVNTNSFANEIGDSEKLYVEIKNFLESNKNVSPKDFAKVCCKYMLEEVKTNSNVSKKCKNIILYRGVKNLEYASNFKRGIFFMSIWNVRGSGVYTTTNKDCAKFYSDEKNPKTLITMQIDLNNVKILENDYLEKLKQIIIANHKEEFGEFNSKTEEDFILDSLKDYVDEAFEETYKKIEKLQGTKKLQYEEKLLKEKLNQLEADPVFQKLKSERKKFYVTNKSCVWFNNGLLTKLLGYDVLYCVDFLRDFVDVKEEEYLIVNTQILKI